MYACMLSTQYKRTQVLSRTAEGRESIRKGLSFSI